MLGDVILMKLDAFQEKRKAKDGWSEAEYVVIHQVTNVPMYVVGDDGGNMPYMNHIVCEHCNANYGCGQCLKEVFTTGQQLKGHLKIYVGFPKEAQASTPSLPEKEGTPQDPSLESLQASNAATMHPCTTWDAEAPTHPISKGVMECLLSLEADRAWGPLSILLEVVVLMGQTKENWSSVSLS